MNTTDLDVAIVGAGFAGLQALHRLRAQGLRVRVFEAGDGVGGTWYWNRYPGARVDIESLEYSVAFDEDIQREWVWPERYAGQPDVLRYIGFVADRLDLRRDISFTTRVTSMVLDEEEMVWDVTTDRGERIRARFVVGAVGFLSDPYVPDIAGLDDFAGTVVHTGRWPHDGIALAGRKVAILGTGATAVQVTPIAARDAESVTVLARSPMWCVPLRNMPMPDGYQETIKADYPELRRRELEESWGGFLLVDFAMRARETRLAMEVSEEQREAEYELCWRSGGLAYYNSFPDLVVDERANDTLRRFFERKVRELVDDPATAEALIPDHPPLSKRLCGETGYFEAFNRDNVHLVDIRADPIARVVGNGVELAGGARHEVDVLILATGFDAGTGPLTRRMSIVGRGGVSLAEHWADGARTHVGMMCHGFPNLFLLDGPQSPAAFFSPPLLTDYQATFIGRVISELDARDVSSIEPRRSTVDDWSAHVDAIAAATLLPTVNSWWMGANVPGKPRQSLYYLGGFPEYRRRCELALETGFEEYELGGARSVAGRQ